MDEKHEQTPAPQKAAAMEGDRELALMAEELYTTILQETPGVTVRDATNQEDEGVPGIENPLAIDRVGIVNGRHAFVAQITTSSMGVKYNKMLRHTLEMPFVPTRRLVDYNPQDPPLIPRMNIRIENGLMRRYAVDRDLGKHPEISNLVRKQMLANIAMHIERMTHDAKGKKLPASQLAKIRESDSMRLLAELQVLFSEEAQ